jgi:hypothetical protein
MMNIYDQIYDVAVIGGGPSGIAAAVAAARNGANTLLIERYGFLGGMATNASVPVFCPYSDGEKSIIKGIGLEVLEGMQKEAWVNPQLEEGNGLVKLDWVPIDPEILKRVLDDIVLNSGCKILFHTFMEEVVSEDEKVKEVIVTNKEGKFSIRAKVFVDCTGDADVVAKAGGEFEYGDELGLVQAVTLCFRIANVDGEKFSKYKIAMKETGNLAVAVARARENNDFDFDEQQVATFVLQHNSMAGINFGHVFEVNPLKAEDLTRAEMESRKKIPALMSFLTKYVPGLENAVLASSGPFIGLRESRRIVGCYRLTKGDYLNRERFFDTIAMYAYPIDIHPSRAKDVIYEDDKQDFHTLQYKAGESYGIPFRAMLPKKLKNIVVAGRTLSADRAMHGSFRVMPCCFATGQAAGTAAALCTLGEEELSEIDIKRLQTTLKQQGAFIE